ncbi:MAG: acyloxyacyl hydrolase [Alphaproteobacteria bacterium]|nr:acyloxyacyl hydrolase [Alphaproteobacteria bacterium]
MGVADWLRGAIPAMALGAMALAEPVAAGPRGYDVAPYLPAGEARPAIAQPIYSAAPPRVGLPEMGFRPLPPAAPPIHATPAPATTPYRAGPGYGPIETRSSAPAAGGPAPPPAPGVPTPPPASSVSAASGVSATAATWLEEVRLGFLAHSIGPINQHYETGMDINPEILFRSPGFLRPILAPLPTIGATINTADDTSIFYAGLTWRADFLERFTGSFFFGGAVHDGALVDDKLGTRHAFGCRVLFREGIDLGVKLDQAHVVSLFLDHVSHVGLCADVNQGNDNFGLRLHRRL